MQSIAFWFLKEVCDFTPLLMTLSGRKPLILKVAQYLYVF